MSQKDEKNLLYESVMLKSYAKAKMKQKFETHVTFFFKAILFL